MEGRSVLAPMGWDAFGLPAENAALKNDIHPAVWTKSNISKMKEQFHEWGVLYDWDREVTSCEPDYYKWTQWIFVQLFKSGLAYRKAASVNWCPSCKTVLANEQVVNGFCWRCDAQVEPRQLAQWFLKITDYADDLLAYCDQLPGWPDKVTTMQRNWIGKSVGAEIRFPVENQDVVIPVFTTRHDTVFGATFMCLAPEHPLTIQLSRNTPQEKQVAAFVEKMSMLDRSDKAMEEYEKEGVFLGANCINPLSGKRIPIYTANFALMEYGTGAVMAVPAHDQRDLILPRNTAWISSLW
jgi:leucyl-tRNA synthetase